MGVKWALRFGLVAISCLLFAPEVVAHTSSQSFVLLLPTHLYITAGVAAVFLTVVLLAIPKFGTRSGLDSSHDITKLLDDRLSTVSSLGSLVLLIGLMASGLLGSRDPLVNPLPLFTWTVWWIGLVTLQALLGGFWSWFNPWTGLYRLLIGSSERNAPMKLPTSLGQVPALFGLVLFFAFMLAHPAPEDPALLTKVVGAYVLFTFAAMFLFGGETWLERGEFLTVLQRNFAKMAVFGTRDGRLRMGLPGWQLLNCAPPALSAGLFVLVMLGTSSFDGLNETFWWLVVLGINPLEFPGRSAIIWQTVGGILLFNVLLVSIFSACLFYGLRLIGEANRIGEVFGRFVLTLLPIAVAYHIAHFLPAFLVNIQYSLAAASDPLGAGTDLLGLGTFYVTTGFFNHRDTVQLIYLSQTIVVVAGHMLSILSAHAVALELFKENRRAIRSQLPLVLFMIGYTFFGLWLLAAPRGA